MEEKRIVEIDGVKIEVDLRTAKRIDTFRVGDNVKVLCKEYNGDFKVKPGIITDFCNFKEKSSISVFRIFLKSCNFSKTCDIIKSVIFLQQLFLLQIKTLIQKKAGQKVHDEQRNHPL